MGVAHEVQAQSLQPSLQHTHHMRGQDLLQRLAGLCGEPFESEWHYNRHPGTLVTCPASSPPAGPRCAAALTTAARGQLSRGRGLAQLRSIAPLTSLIPDPMLHQPHSRPHARLLPFLRSLIPPASQHQPPAVAALHAHRTSAFSTAAEGLTVPAAHALPASAPRAPPISEAQLEQLVHAVASCRNVVALTGARLCVCSEHMYVCMHVHVCVCGCVHMSEGQLEQLVQTAAATWWHSQVCDCVCVCVRVCKCAHKHTFMCV